MDVAIVNYTGWGSVNIGVASLIVTLRQEGHNVSLIDAVFMDKKGAHTEILRKLKLHRPEVICFSRGFDSSGLPALLGEVCQEFRDIPIVIGGVLPTATPENAGSNPESLHGLIWTVSGEGNSILARLIERFGKEDFTIPHHIAAPPEDITRLPVPDFTSFDMRRYFRVATRIDGELPLYASKGCPYRCSFCSLCKRPFQHRKPQQVLEEMKIQEERHRRDGLKSFLFYDPTFGVLRKEFNEMMGLFHEDHLDERVTWFCETRAELVTRGWAMRAARGGCQLVELGVDCGNKAVRDGLLNKSTTDGQFRAAVRNLRDTGLQYEVNLITGLPGTGFSTDVQSLLFAMSLKPVKINIGRYYPLQDTPLGRACLLEKGKWRWHRWMKQAGGEVIRLCTLPQFMHAGISCHGRAYIREFLAYALNVRGDRMRHLLHRTSRHILSRWPNSRLFRERLLEERGGRPEGVKGGPP